MSRRGKVSRGCGTCRKRKIRCDETLPVCRQCLKAGWDCPKYGDVTERLFQNRTVADFLVGSSPKLASAGESYPVQLDVRKHTLPQHIILPIEDRAIDLFLASHVPRDTVFIRGCFEYLPEFRQNNSRDPGFLASLNVAALAAYGNTVQSSSVQNKARTYLGSAIRHINSALMSPQEAVKDSTVISIMLLATFETITCRDQKSLKDCDMHTKGATAIIELRGHGQLQTRLGMQLFVQMCGDISRGCLQRSVRVPAGVIAARSHAAKLLGNPDIAWQLSDLVIELADFRASVKDGSLSKPEDIQRCGLKIDGRLSALVDGIPTKYKFEVFSSAGPNHLIWEGFYHVYPSFWAAYFWNNVRTCRMLLHQEIHRQAKHFGLDSESQSSFSLNIIRQMSLDICASVPQYSGYLPLLESFPKVLTGSETQSPPKLLPGSSVHAHAVYSLIWPLLIVGYATKSDEHRLWIVERARDIGRTTGIHQAFALADVLEKQERIHVWDD
ncbi:hypothetical protein VTL71DRAFT_5616 [Oculimacula yallundae]|uniref:Zn(2)-C6 fungal-type domain-containing protein n=1 Tax=Oculimacula yallundae TaxID=86028 RepID=A0ABR4C361_9HELO